MAKYERFLSYLFEYKGDYKGVNCGFARVEVRGDVRRIQIVVKTRDSAEFLRVCGFYRKNGYCIRVPLGRMMINGGSGQFQYQMTGAWFKEEEIAFEQLAGLVIDHFEKADYAAYATVWDDEAFGLSMFEDEKKSEAEEIANVESLEEKEEKAKTESAAENKEEFKIEGAAENKEEPKIESAVENKEELKVESAAENKEELKIESAVENKEEPKIESAAENKEEPKVENEADKEEEPSETEEVLFAESCDVSSNASALRDTDAFADADLFWAGLCKCFRKIETLPQEEQICLKAMPSDIGRLPRRNWILGNNGFLIYSFVRYRYIVFARIKRDAFELWLPGTYEANEERLAKMFGFSHFRSMKSKNAQQGDFGYWCIPLSYRDEEPWQRKAEKEKEMQMRHGGTTSTAEAG